MEQLRTRKRDSAQEQSFEGAKVNGKRNPINHGGCRTRAEAITAGTQVKARYDSAGRRLTPSGISVSDYLNYWCDSYVKTNLSYSIQEGHGERIRVHLKPIFGKYQLASLETDIIQEWVDGMKHQGCSRSMVKNILSCLSGALGCAIYLCKYIEYNPRDYTRTLRIVMSDETRAHTEYICVKEDFTAIIGRFGPDNNFYVPLMTGYHCDTRPKEAYGIDLPYDIDFEHYTIAIQHQLTNEGGRWYYRPSKYNSVQTIKILPEYEKILKTKIHNRKKNVFRYGQYSTKTYQMDGGLIFQVPSDVKTAGKEIVPVSAKENNELLTPYSFKYCAKVIHGELGSPLFHSHCLRHTHGTLLAESGAQSKTIVERLGHKNIKTTTNRYVLNTERVQNNAIIILVNAIS